MADCPLADECPSFTERIAGMGCQHYGDRSGKEWCNHYGQPIDELKSQPVTVGEEVVVEITDVHRSGAGVGRTEDGFIVLVDGILPAGRARAEITSVRSNHAKADLVERLPLEEETDDDEDASDAADDGERDDGTRKVEERAGRQRLGSRENFWGG